MKVNKVYFGFITSDGDIFVSDTLERVTAVKIYLGNGSQIQSKPTVDELMEQLREEK